MNFKVFLLFASISLCLVSEAQQVTASGVDFSYSQWINFGQPNRRPNDLNEKLNHNGTLGFRLGFEKHWFASLNARRFNYSLDLLSVGIDDSDPNGEIVYFTTESFVQTKGLFYELGIGKGLKISENLNLEMGGQFGLAPRLRQTKQTITRHPDYISEINRSNSFSGANLMVFSSVSAPLGSGFVLNLGLEGGFYNADGNQGYCGLSFGLRYHLIETIETDLE